MHVGLSVGVGVGAQECGYCQEEGIRSYGAGVTGD